MHIAYELNYCKAQPWFLFGLSISIYGHFFLPEVFDCLFVLGYELFVEVIYTCISFELVTFSSCIQGGPRFEFGIEQFSYY